MGSVYQMVKDSLPFPMVEEWIARNIPLEPDQHGYREGVLRIGDIQRAIISVYDFTYISDAESMGLGIFFVRQDMAVFLHDGVCLLVRDLITEVAGIRGTGLYGDLSCARISDFQGRLYGIVQSIREQGTEADRVDALYIMEIYMEEAVNALPGCLAVFSVENGIDDAVLAEYPVLHGNLGLYFFKIFFGFHSVFGIKKILYHT